MKGARGFRLERREDTGLGLQAVALVVALGAALAMTALLIAIAGASPGEGFAALFRGAFGSWKIFIATLVKATPLILTALAATVAFRANIWNIGAEGQLFAGAILAYGAATALASFPPGLLIPVVLVAAMLGGASWALIAAVLKTRFGVSEIISTVLLNYIVLFLLSWLLSNPWRDPNSFYQHSPEVSESLRLPVLIGDTRLHLGFAIAIAVVLIYYLLLDRTPLGYEIRALGANPRASLFQGTDVGKLTIVVMLLSGAVAGLAGAGELFGIHFRLKSEISLGYGFTGIIIAMLAGLHPLAIIPAAILFSGLITGSSLLQIKTGVPASLVTVIEALVLLFLLSARAMISYRFRRPSGEQVPNGG